MTPSYSLRYNWDGDNEFGIDPAIMRMWREFYFVQAGQELLLAKVPEILTGFVRNFPSLSTVILAGSEDGSLLPMYGSDFRMKGRNLDKLLDVDLRYFCHRDWSPNAPTAIFSRMAMALADAGATITDYQIELGITEFSRIGSGPSFAKAFKNCRRLRVSYDAKRGTVGSEITSNLISEMVLHATRLETLQIRIEMEAYLDDRWVGSLTRLIPSAACANLRNTLRTLLLCGGHIHVEDLEKLVLSLTPGLKVLKVAKIYLGWADTRNAGGNGWARIAEVSRDHGAELVQLGPLWQYLPRTLKTGWDIVSQVRHAPCLVTEEGVVIDYDGVCLREQKMSGFYPMETYNGQ